MKLSHCCSETVCRCLGAIWNAILYSSTTVLPAVSDNQQGKQYNIQNKTKCPCVP